MILKGKKALLLAEGCKINKEKKKLEKRLAEIKAEIDLKVPDTYLNEAGDELTVSEVPNFSDVDPKKVIDYLRKQKLSTRFPEVVKVQITALRKIVPESVFSKWRIALDSSMKFTWK